MSMCREPKEHQKEGFWLVMMRRCNMSAFSGYRVTSSDYSEVKCVDCGCRWRTKANYVDDLPDSIHVIRVPR
jgi:hypothetical protein